MGSAEAGEETYAQVQNISQALHAPIEKVGALTNELLVSGLDNQERLRNTVEAITELARVQGDEAGSRLKGLVERNLATGHFTLSARQLKGIGVSADELYREIGAKVGIGAKQVAARIKAGTLDISTGLEALNEHIIKGKIGERARSMFKLEDIGVDFKNTMQEIFEGIDTSPFLDALKGIGSLFDKNNASGQTMREVIVGAFNQIFKWAGIATEKITLGFIYAQIYMYKAYNTLYPLINAFRKMVAFVPWMMLLKIGLVAVAAALTLLVSPFLIAAAAGTAFWALMTLMVTQSKDVGLAIINGLIDGIKGGATAVWDAIKGVATGALNTAKSVLGIHSPSIEMMKLGQHTSAGFSQGVSSGEDKSQSAMGNMMRPPSVERQQSGGGGKVITINLGGVQITGVKGAEEMAPMFETMFTDLMERVTQEVRGG